MEKQRAIEAALQGFGFVQDPKVKAKWTRPSRAEWVEDDRAMVMPYDQGEHYLTTMTLYLHDEETVKLLSPLTDEEREALEWAKTMAGAMARGHADMLPSTLHQTRAEAFSNLLSRTQGVSSSSVPSPEIAPSYHDVVVYVDGQAHKISDNYAYELTCTRTGGWQLWWRGDGNWTGVVQTGQSSAASVNPSMPNTSKNGQPMLIGGEFHGGECRIEVNGVTVCTSKAQQGGAPDDR